MIITFHGEQYAKLQLGDTTIAINPTSLTHDKKAHRFGANIVLITTPVSPYDGSETASYNNAEPFVIDGPGEYEIGDLTIMGAAAGAHDGWRNTAYVFVMDGIKVTILGNVHAMSDVTALRELVGDTNIIMIPIGGDYGPDAGTAYAIAQSFSSNIIIPLCDDGEAIKTFLKEASTKAEPTDKITLKTRDVENREGDILLISRAS